MARPQKKGGQKFIKNKKPYGKKTEHDDKVSKSLAHDVFEAAEESSRRKGNDLDEVDNLEYDAGEIDEEDDEEIDSDEAFDESDEERFEGYKFYGSTKKSDKKSMQKAVKASSGEIDLNEDSEEESEDESADDFENEEGEGFMDLSQMLGGDDDDEDAAEEQSDDDEEEEEFRGFDDIEDDESDDDENMELDDKVVDLIDSIDTKKRRRTDTEEGSTKKRQLKERNEAYKEGEFNLNTREEDESTKKISLADLMGTVDDESTFGTLKSGLETLAGKGKNLTRRALDAPLPKRIQDRLERTAAATAANEEITKWQPTIKMNREAEHLSFPMQDVNVRTQEGKTSAAMASKFKAETPLEQQIAEALAQAGMKDEELEEFEALKLNKLTVEEVEEKRKELRLMRELMFRHEIKNKRLKKIKSKSYRKLQRKEKDKLALQIKDMTEIDHEMDGEDKVDAAMSRAEERMSLKHKNTSKWAKRALARGTQDEGTRDAIMEQLRRGEELRRRIDGDQSEDEDSDEQVEDDEVYVNNQLSKLNDEIANDTQPAKGLLSMKFMQDAAKRQLDATKQDVANFEKEWLAQDSDDDEAEKKEEHYSVVANNPGRMAFGAKAKQVKKSKAVDEEVTEEQDDSEVGLVTVNEAGQIKKVSHSASHKTSTSTHINLKNISPLADLDDNDSSNPWLQADTSRLSKKASKNNKVVSSQTESRVEHSISKLNKTKKEKASVNDTTEDVELDLTKVMSIKSQKPANTKATKQNQRKSTPSNVATAKQIKGDSDSDSDDGSDNEDDQMVHNDKVSFSQRELVARAFANDDVVAEFEDEKLAEIEEDGDKVEDLTLPGWGSWGGSGVKKNRNKKKILKVTKGIEAEKRKDAKLSHVIINEKLNKKAEKYRVTSVPFPFKTMEQYERSISQPVGSEWNTRETFMKMTKPRVITKLGKVIDPLKAPFA